MEFKKTGFNSVHFNEPQKLEFCGKKPFCEKESNSEEVSKIKPSLWQKIKNVHKIEQNEENLDVNNPSFINPKTGKFDPKLVLLRDYFAQKYKETGSVQRGHIKEITLFLPLFVNENTGEIDDNLVNFTEKYLIYPYTSEGRREYIKKRDSEMFPYYMARVLGDILKGIKDNTGASNTENVKEIEKLTSDGNRLLAKGKLSWLPLIKDEKGVIDSERNDYIISRQNDFSCHEQIKDFAEGMNILGVRKADKFYKNLSNAFNEKMGGYSTLSAFLPAIHYCFDKDKKFLREELNKISDVGSILKGTYIDEKILNFIQPKENRTLIKKLSEKGREFTSDDMKLFASLAEKHSDETGAVLPELRNKALRYVTENLDLKRFVINFNFCMIKEGGKAYFDEKKFKQLNIFYETKLKNCPYYDRTSNKYLHIILGQKDISTLNFKEKLVMLGTVDEILYKNRDDSDIQELRPIFETLQKDLNIKTPVLSVKDEDKKPFMETILGYKGVKKGELSRFESVMINSIPKLKKMNKGLPLLYSRKEFIKDLNKICNTEEKKKAFQDKAGIELHYDSNGQIIYYDGLINMSRFNQNDEFENSLYKVCHKFFYKNKIQTGDDALDIELNKIIKAAPEFINTIGKPQHGTQQYSLDIHQLIVLANSIKNPEYKNLRNIDKVMLKSVCIFHDIMKKEAVIDKGHQDPSSVCARDIAAKFFSNQESIERLYELSKNHHWLETYNTAANKSEKAREIAFMFRRPYDFEIAKIMARADLMGVSDSFYDCLKHALDESNISEINDRLKDIYSTGCVILSDYPKTKNISEKHKESLNGKNYNVINFHNIKDDENLSEYGFEFGRTKKDLQLLVHMVSDNVKSDLDNLNLLLKSTNNGVLSESLIDVIKPKTFLDRKYGVILSQINSNTVNTSRYNQGSANEKDNEKILHYIFKNYEERKKCLQTILRYMRINPYLISKDELAKFYKENLADKTSFSQFTESKKYKLADKEFTGKDLKRAIFEYQQRLITKTGDMNNEIIGYEPKIKAVIAKEKCLKDVPSSLLDFAHNNNLPIVLI